MLTWRRKKKPLLESKGECNKKEKNYRDNVNSSSKQSRSNVKSKLN